MEKLKYVLYGCIVGITVRKIWSRAHEWGHGGIVYANYRICLANNRETPENREYVGYVVTCDHDKEAVASSHPLGRG
jgi:hypothetical protein